MAFNFFKSYYGNLYKDAYKEANNAYQQILKVNNDLNESKLTYVNAPTFKSITKGALELYQQVSNNKDTYESSQLKYGIDSLVSQTLNVPVSEVAKNRNIYWKNLFDTEDEKTIFEAIGDSYRSYYVMQDIANLNNKLYNSTDQIEIESLEEQISDLEDEYARLSDPNKPFRGMVFNSIVESAAQLPNTIHSALIAAGGTAALTLLSPAFGIAIAPKIALAGGSIAANLYVYSNTANTEAGMMINDLRKLTDSNGNKIDLHDPEIKSYINWNKRINGALEVFSDLGFEFMLNQGLIKPISNSLKGTVKNTVNTAFKKTFANRLKSTGKFVGATILDTISESTTEGLENATSNYFMNEILKYSNNTIGSDYEVVDEYGFENFVNEFADGFIESIPVSATLGITGAGFGKAINYASYKYDKVKTKRASDIYGIDFEGQKVNNEFSTVENNAFSDEKYKLVNKDIFNINPSKMSDEAKKIYNEMVIVKDTEEGATTISNDKFKTLFGENKHSTEKPEGYEQYTIKDKKTGDTIDVFIKKGFSVPKVEVDQNNNLVAFKDAESEATVVTQNVIDMVNGNSSVPIETFKISPTFDNSNNNYNKSFNDIQQLQRYIDHYIDDKNKTIEFKTKFAAEEFLKNAKKNNLAIKGSNYISDVTKSGTITFKIGDELVDFNVTYLSDNNKTNSLAQTYYALPKKLKDFMETNDMLDSGYLNREVIEESYAQDYIKKSIENKFAQNKTDNTQKISGKHLKKIIDAGATSLYAIYRKTGLSPESFMDLIDFRIADNGEMKNLNGLLTKARSTLAQTYAEASIDEADQYYFEGGNNHTEEKPEGYRVKYNEKNNTFITPDGKYSFIRNDEEQEPVILKHNEKFGSFEEDARLKTIYNYLADEEDTNKFAIDDTLEKLEDGEIKTPIDLISSLKNEPTFAKGNFNRALAKLFSDTQIADIYVAGRGEAFIINDGSLDFVKNEEEKPKTKKKAKAEQKVDTTTTDTKADENVEIKDTLDTNLDTLDTVETAKQEEQTTGETEQKTEKEKEESSKSNTVDNYKYTITITKNANVSTIVHEAGHILRDILSQDELNKVSEIYNVDIDDWYSGSDVEKSANGTFIFNNKEYITKQEALKAKDKTVRAEEQFANDFTMYLATATSPAPALNIVFNKIKNILTGIAETLVKNGTFREGKLNADIENLFASLLMTKDDIIHRELLKNNVEVELDIKEDEPEVADEGQELPQENSKINVYFKDMNVTNGGLENVEITKSDIKLFVEKGYYVPISVLEKVAATNKRDFIVKVNGEKIAISKYMQLRHELENGERNLYQVAYSQGIDVASSLISNEDSNKEIKISILEREIKSSVRPTQYIGRIVYKLLNDDKFLTTICRKITDYFVPILKDNTKLIELRKYDAVENEVTLLSKKLIQSFGDDRKSMMDLIRKNIKANPGLWAREVFRSETLFDVYQPSEATQWYYDGFLSPEQKYSNFLLKFGSDEGFESIHNDINFKDLSEEQLDKIEDKLSELDDKLGYFDSDLDNIVYIDRFNADDIQVWNAHVLNSMNRKYDVLKRSSIYNIKQLFKDINKESFKISYEQINNLLKELQNEIRKQKLNSEDNIKLDEEFGRLFEYVNNDVNSYDSFMQSIKDLIDNNYGFGLNEDETNLSEESLLKIKTIQKDLHDSIERMMFVHFENEQAINSLMKNLNDTVKNKELNDTIKAHEKNLSTMYKSIEKAMNKISKQQELIDNLVAENKLLNKEYATASSRLRTEYTRRYKNQITKITKLSNAYDCSIESLMSYINYLIGNRVVVKDKNQEITDRIFSDYQDLIDNISNNDNDLYKTEDDYLKNNDMENVYETVVYSPEGEAIQNFRTIALTLNEDPSFVKTNITDDIKDSFDIIGDSYIERGQQLVKQFPVQLYNELTKTLPYNINVNYAVEQMVYHNFSEWGVDIQKSLYKAVQNLKQQAKEQRQDIIRQKQNKALELSKKMIESLSKDLKITEDDIKYYITNYLQETGLTTDVNKMSDYEILDYFYDFDNNKNVTYADLVSKYNGQNAFEIIAQDDNFRYRMLKDIISRDSRNKLTFRNKTLKSFEKLKKNATDRFRIWMSQPTLIFNYLSELSGDLAEDEFSGAFEQFFIRELLKCDNQEQLNIANRMKDSATNFSNIFGIKFEDREKIFEATDKVYTGNGKYVSLEESGLNPIRATFFNNSNNTLTKEESLLTRQQVIGLYIYSKNLTTDKMTFQNREYNVNTVYSHSAINLMDVKGNNFGEEFIVDLHNNPTSYLTEQEIQWADYMIKHVGSKGNETFNLMKDLYNINMTMEENYFPMVNGEYVNIISSKSGLTYVKPSANHTVERTHAVYPIDLNVCNTFERSIKQQEHLLAFAEWADTFNRIWKYQGNLENTLNKVVGNELTEYVFDFSKLAANRQYFRSNNEMTFMNKVLANQSVAKVVGSLITIARQAGSLLSSQLNLKISPKEIANAMMLINKKIAGTDMTWAEYIDSVDPEMLNRKLDPITEQALSRNKQSWIKDMPVLSKLHPDELIKLVQIADKKFAQIVWIACFNKYSNGVLNLSTDVTKNDALYKTIMAVRKTQSGSSIVENTKLQNSAKYGNNYIAKLIVQFQNDILKMQSEIFFGAARAWRNGKRIDTAVKALLVPISMALFNVILNGDWIPEEDDDTPIDIDATVKDIVSELANNWLPVAGKYVSNTIRGYGSTSFVPFADSISNLISTIAKLYNPPKGRERLDVALSGIYNIGLDVASSVGVPSEFIRRVAKMFIDVKDWEFNFNPFYFINTNAGNWLAEKLD